GERLYNAVLAPIAAPIAAHRTLIFAPDGALHYVPFATLRGGEAAGKAFLVENHDLAVTPSIEMLLSQDVSHPEAVKQMLLVADPVYEPRDSRIAARVNPKIPNQIRTASATLLSETDAALLSRGPGTTEHLERLPGATREAAAIAALLPADSVDLLDGLSA